MVLVMVNCNNNQEDYRRRTMAIQSFPREAERLAGKGILWQSVLARKIYSLFTRSVIGFATDM